jgi:hypothetical protein
MKSTTHDHSHDPKTRGSIHTFVRNRYFYGKLLDVFHFELEQNYFNGKRWMLNRLVTGYGVLCGLDVIPAPEGRAVIVTPGAGIDRCGREIIVPRNSNPMKIRDRPPHDPTKPAPPTECDTDCWVTLSICFKQCESNPVPVMVDECGLPTTCSASAIQESYELQIEDGRAPKIDLTSSVPNFVMNGRLNYGALVDAVTRGCDDLPADCCFPLANICLPSGSDPIQIGDIDITIRPIVYSNPMLLDMMLALADELPTRARGGK